MRYTINEIANLLDGKVIGNSNISINNIQKIEVAQKGDISFIANSKYLKHLSLTKASAVIIDNNYNYDGIDNTTLIVVNDAYLSLAKLIQKFEKKQNIKNIISDKSEIGNNLKSGDNLSVGSFTKIGDNVKVGDNVTIMNNCSIGDDVIISDNTIIYPSVNIYHSCEIGVNNIIHSGVVIGSDGFGFAQNKKSFNKIAQIGNVKTEENVEIGANTTIDRGTIGSTLIKSGVKLDNQIQIGHNVTVGSNTVIAGLVAVAGSTMIGDNCMIGGQCAIAGHLKIGNNVKIAGNSGVGSNIKDNQTIQGIYAFNKQDFQRSYIMFKRLPLLSEKIDRLMKHFK